MEYHADIKNILDFKFWPEKINRAQIYSPTLNN